MSFVIPYTKPKDFKWGWDFAERHMTAVREALGSLPAKIFFDIDTAPIKKDMEQATDLILSVSGGDIAVRVRSRKYWDGSKKYPRKPYPEWSIRAENKGYKTEIDKIKQGFGRWYFMAYSADNQGSLVAWWLLDLDRIRLTGVLDEEKWPTHPNGDGTAGKYIPIERLIELDCIIASHRGY